MSRRKFRNSPRHEPQSQRSFQEYILNQPAPPTTRAELTRLIRGGEDTFLELKVKLSNPERIAQEIIALANTAGGAIIFGVTDNLRVEGVDYPEDVQEELVRICREDIYPPLVPLLDVVAFDNGRRVVVLDVDGKRPPYRTRDGRFYLRIGSEKREATREELSMFLEEIRPLNYENIPVPGAAENDIDDALLWSFARVFEDEADRRYVYNTADFLKKDLLLAVGTAEEFIPTVAAISLFGKNDRVAKFIPRSMVKLVRYAGENANSPVIDAVEFSGSLLTLYESIMRFIKRYADLWEEKRKVNTTHGSSPVIARANYAQNVVREAVTNALIHRDLALRDVETKILMFDNHLEIVNPRRTNGFVPPASRAIRYGITQRLNPQIAAIFTSPAYEAEIARGGLPMILKEARSFSGRRADIFTSNDEFRLKIYGA